MQRLQRADAPSQSLKVGTGPLPLGEQGAVLVPVCRDAGLQGVEGFGLLPFDCSKAVNPFGAGGHLGLQGSDFEVLCLLAQPLQLLSRTHQLLLQVLHPGAFGLRIPRWALGGGTEPIPAVLPALEGPLSFIQGRGSGT